MTESTKTYRDTLVDYFDKLSCGGQFSGMAAPALIFTSERSGVPVKKLERWILARRKKEQGQKPK